MADLTEQERRSIQRARRRKAAADIGHKRGSERRSFGNILDSIHQDLTLGFGDELWAHQAAILGVTPEGSWFDYSNPYQNRYDRALTAERAQRDQFKKDNPTTNFIAEAGGAMIPALLSGGTSALASGGAGLGRAALTGAGGGAIYGFGQGEGQGNRLNKLLTFMHFSESKVRNTPFFGDIACPTPAKTAQHPTF